jgi:hypothetical protein
MTERKDLENTTSMTDIPPLDTETANQLLNNVFSACDMQPNTIPIEVLESWGNYKKPRFQIAKKITYFMLVILILLPLMFFKPTIVADRSEIGTTDAVTYEISIKTLLPISSVTAALDGEPVTLYTEDMRHYTAKLTKNGTFEITAVSFNGQTVTRTYTVSQIDTDRPEYVDSYSKDGYVYIIMRDTYSGIDYDNITGLKPEEYDENTGLITFKVPDEATTVTIPDKAGNETSLLLSPIN